MFPFALPLPPTFEYLRTLIPNPYPLRSPAAFRRARASATSPIPAASSKPQHHALYASMNRALQLNTGSPARGPVLRQIRLPQTAASWGTTGSSAGSVDPALETARLAAACSNLATRLPDHVFGASRCKSPPRFGDYGSIP